MYVERQREGVYMYRDRKRVCVCREVEREWVYVERQREGVCM